MQPVKMRTGQDPQVDLTSPSVIAASLVSSVQTLSGLYCFGAARSLAHLQAAHPPPSASHV